MTLVREFVTRQSEPAFTMLVERHVALVHSAALRQTGDAHLAEEITQAVFIILARKAASLGMNTILPAWLYRTTRYAAGNALKVQHRRRAREQEAYMQSTLQSDDTANAWYQLAPLLDEAMAELAERDRATLVLRYFENRPWREVATLTHVTEDAAQKRLRRALEKLRTLFTKRGVTLTAVVIASAIAANSVQAAPMGMAAKVSTAAGAGSAAAASISSIAKGTMKMMSWVKFKTAIATGAIALFAAATLTAGIAAESAHYHALKLLAQVQQKYASFDSLSYEVNSVLQTDSKTNWSTGSVRLARLCSYRTVMHTSGSSESDSLSWSLGDYSLSYITWLTNTLYRIKSTPAERLKHYDGLNLDSTLPTCLPTQFFFDADSRNPFKILTHTNTEVSVSPAGIEPIAGHDCQKLVINLSKLDKTLTLWIGRNDLLIYRTELDFEKAESKLIAGKLVWSPAIENETYMNIAINPPLQPDDFIPESIPPNLTIKETFP